MITLREIGYQWAGKILYQSINIQINTKEKTALIGNNGTGKTTLFKLFLGSLIPSEGRIIKKKGLKIGILEQSLLDQSIDIPIKEWLMNSFEEVTKLEKKIDKVWKNLEKEYSEKLLTKLTNLQTAWEQAGGKQLVGKVEQFLTNMGFPQKVWKNSFNSFSGGWKMRLFFMKLLLEEPDLLLLDEPTNHLDIETIGWVEKVLFNYPKAYWVISHDSRFLNKITNKTIELYNKQAYIYAGNYSFFIEEKRKRLIEEKKIYNNEKKEIERISRFITKFRSNNSRAKQVQSRIKSLKRRKIISPPVQTSNMKIHFPTKEISGKKVIEIQSFTKKIGRLHLFDNANILVTRGERIALIGENGKGKSTLLKVITGLSPIDKGSYTLGHKVKIGYHAQHHIENLAPGKNILETVEEVIEEGQTSIRSLLAAFLFFKEDVYKKVAILSGGERARLSLARTMLMQPNFLILDEPTNHLDISSITALSYALQHYEGTILFVSHNRDFISHNTNIIWQIESKKIVTFPGNYENFCDWKEQHKNKN